MQKVLKLLRKIINTIGRWNTIAILSSIILLVALWGITFGIETQKRSLADQLQASRWTEDGDSAQISFFFSERLAITPTHVAGVRHQIDTKLTEQAIEANHSLARRYVDAYASFGRLAITGERKSIDAEAIGVGGDFFLFHPVELLCGQYFAESDIRKDIILLDEEVAWQLFGSSDIVGKDVLINEIYFKVVGVFSRSRGELETLAGSRGATVYLPYESLVRINGILPISTYEIVMPNPVKGFARKIAEECLSYNANDMLVIENSERFSYEAFYRILKEREARSMKTNDIILPFWENLARVKEEKLAVMAAWQVSMATLLIVYWLGAIIIFIVRHKPTKEGILLLAEQARSIVLRIGKAEKETIE